MLRATVSRLVADFVLHVRHTVVQARHVLIERLCRGRDDVVLFIERHEHLLYCVRTLPKELSARKVLWVVNCSRPIVALNGIGYGIASALDN